MLQNDFIFKEVLATLAMENLTLTQAEQELVIWPAYQQGETDHEGEETE